MTRKEKIELLLSKLAEEQKADFVAALRETKTPEERQALLKQFQIHLTEEEKAAFNAPSNEVSDAELDMASGGGCCKCGCSCDCAY